MNKKSNVEIMEKMTEIYAELPHIVHRGTGGWVEKRILFAAYPLSSKSSTNEHYNRVAEMWQETKNHALVYCKPVNDWDKQLHGIVMSNIDALSIGMRMLQDLEAMESRLKSFVNNSNAFQHIVKNKYAGLFADIRDKVHDSHIKFQTLWLLMEE